MVEGIGSFFGGFAQGLNLGDRMAAREEAREDKLLARQEKAKLDKRKNDLDTIGAVINVFKIEDPTLKEWAFKEVLPSLGISGDKSEELSKVLAKSKDAYKYLAPSLQRVIKGGLPAEAAGHFIEKYPTQFIGLIAKYFEERSKDERLKYIEESAGLGGTPRPDSKGAQAGNANAQGAMPSFKGTGQPVPLELNEAQKDLIVRTMIGEAAGEAVPGRVAAMAVMLNRIQKGGFGKDVQDVLMGGQFEAWRDPNRKAQLQQIPTDSMAYQSNRQLLDRYLNGEIGDPTGGATHFYNPELNAELAKQDGRKVTPDWAKGQGQRIGAHVFYGGAGQETAVGGSGSAPGMAGTDQDEAQYKRLIKGAEAAARIGETAIAGNYMQRAREIRETSPYFIKNKTLAEEYAKQEAKLNEPLDLPTLRATGKPIGTTRADAAGVVPKSEAEEAGEREAVVGPMQTEQYLARKEGERAMERAAEGRKALRAIGSQISRLQGGLRMIRSMSQGAVGGQAKLARSAGGLIALAAGLVGEDANKAGNDLAEFISGENLSDLQSVRLSLGQIVASSIPAATGQTSMANLSNAERRLTEEQTSLTAILTTKSQVERVIQDIILAKVMEANSAAPNMDRLPYKVDYEAVAKGNFREPTTAATIKKLEAMGFDDESLYRAVQFLADQNREFAGIGELVRP